MQFCNDKKFDNISLLLYFIFPYRFYILLTFPDLPSGTVYFKYKYSNCAVPFKSSVNMIMSSN